MCWEGGSLVCVDAYVCAFGSVLSSQEIDVCSLPQLPLYFFSAFFVRLGFPMNLELIQQFS